MKSCARPPHEVNESAKLDKLTGWRRSGGPRNGLVWAYRPGCGRPGDPTSPAPSSATARLDPAPRELIGLELKPDLWIAWSRRSARHDPDYEPAMAAKWGSFRAGGGVTIGTVLGLGR